MAFIEGLQMQTLVQGTGKAMLELHVTPSAPVQVGDTIWAVITVKSVRPASKHGYGVVSTEVDVLNQKSAKVLTYQVTRLIAGRPD